MRRRGRRAVDRDGIKELIGGDKPGADLYWAAVGGETSLSKLIIWNVRCVPRSWSHAESGMRVAERA